MRLSALLLSASLLALAGCGNACQRMCHRMADYAEECGFTVTDADITACMEEQASVDADTKKSCRQFGDAQQIRNEWTCDELAPYFNGE